jgi:hypothetical protein
MLKKYQSLLFAFIFLLLLFGFGNTLTYAADLTNPPEVTSLTGPTSGIVGGSYNFTTNITSILGSELTYVAIASTTDQNSSLNFDEVVVGNIGGTDPNCTALDCTFSGSFSPSTTGTYYIFTSVGFVGNSCNTHPSVTETNCVNSRGRYITFTVTDPFPNDALLPPEVTSFTGPSTGLSGSPAVFTIHATSTTGNEIRYVWLYETTDLNSLTGETDIQGINVGDITACTALDCIYSGTFTPITAGTYYMYALVGSTPSSPVNCTTHPYSLARDCFNSRGQYITYVATNPLVTDATIPPEVLSITGPTSGVVGTTYLRHMLLQIPEMKYQK